MRLMACRPELMSCTPNLRPWSYYVPTIFVGRLANSRRAELAADASVVVFCLCDVPRYSGASAIGAIRWRNWRGILGGRMYLAAYAQGVGATGLTFFDDDVTAFFCRTLLTKA
jgi:hypothetical protein